jgi:predicted cobalt transporter CbtA
MMKLLLWRGMLAGLIGGLLAATIALLIAEPSIDAAIGFEARHAAHAMAGGGDEELVSRATQKGFGLYTALALYGTALGGLLAIVFAAAHGRLTRLGPRGLALVLGLAAFVVVALVPAIKYPPNPPAVGLHETVRLRTAAYFAMLAVSVVAAGLSAWTFRARGRLATPDRLLAALALYGGIVMMLAALLPAVDEVPADFPASLLWRFRLAALATQALFWLATADLFGRMAERLLPSPAR